MPADANAVYALLPAYIRLRDRTGDRALEEFLSIVGEQAAMLQRDLERMYDDWFVETCDESMIPYIAELLGVDTAHVTAGPLRGERARRLRQVLSARAATANAIAQRRRTGTLWLLEEIARDTAHWPARAVEFYRQVATAVHLDHIQPSRVATADLHAGRGLLDVETPFDSFSHLADVRRITDDQSRGHFNVPSVGLFVWRLRPYSVTRTAAYRREDIGAHCFTFSALGHDTQLVREPVPEAERTGIAAAENLPVPFGRFALETGATADARRAAADPALYGKGRSFYIEAAGWPKRTLNEPITADRVIPADLSTWKYRVPKDCVAVDPVLGRFMFATSQAPRGEVKVTYRYAFAMDIGGGEYAREDIPTPPDAYYLYVSPDGKGSADGRTFPSVAAALAHWRDHRPAPSPSPEAPQTHVRTVVIELIASGVYEGAFDLDAAPQETVIVRAAPGTRAVIWLTDQRAGGVDAITVRGSRGSRVMFDGLFIAGRAVHVSNSDGEDTNAPGDLCEVWIRHSTLVPGSSLQPNCDPRQPAEPSLVVEDTTAHVRIDSSILGAIRILNERTSREAARLSICDSIVDATDPERVAITGPDGRAAHVELTVRRATVVGRVIVYAIRHAEDGIFTSRVEVVRRQVGCVRFCYVPSGSRTPQRYGCQPDGALSAVDVALAPLKGTLAAGDFEQERQRRRTEAVLRVAPRFEAVRFGTAAYLRLSRCAPPEIASGAHDQSEMGVYHDLFEPQRLSMLRDRVSGAVPAGHDAAVMFAT